MSTQPGVISYVDSYSGGLRNLSLALTSGNQMVVGKYRPVVSIDGRQYVVIWGWVTFEVPAERNVHLSVHLEGEYLAQAASVLVEPGTASLAYRFETHYGSGIGTLQPTALPG